ncbi:hypothetical protein HanRHA438_Chr04g0160731 [Helianthus annuus]|nr:hypothetical protein HanRHA438_Chr04g0160731 [Helianthus annuus]
MLMSSSLRKQGRILVDPWQGHGPGKFFGRSANFPHFDRNFVYILCSALASFSAVVLILVSVSFGPGRFNGQDPPLYASNKVTNAMLPPQRAAQVKILVLNKNDFFIDCNNQK